MTEQELEDTTHLGGMRPDRKSKQKELSRVVIGSHSWGLAREDSDEDLFIVFQEPTRKMLRGERLQTSHQNLQGKTLGFDETYHEVGAFINLLIPCNLNMVIGAMSPIVRHTTPEFDTLKRILLDYPAKGIYMSCKGLAMGNYKKYILTADHDTPKKRKLVYRTLKFGLDVIERGVYYYGLDDVPDVIEIADIAKMFAKLDQAYANAAGMRQTYPEQMLRDWLERVRKADLEARPNG